MTPLGPDEYAEARCCFEKGGSASLPDAAPTPGAISVPDIIKELDDILSRGDVKAARLLLERCRGKARELGDWRGELSMQSELMGLLRRANDPDAALTAVEEGLALISAHGLEDTVSGATVTLNAATTLKTLGRAEDSLPLFRRVCSVYSQKLDPADYRFAGLYNNMALSLADTGDLAGAESCYFRAMAVIKTCPDPENELAVTCCNLAELYERADAEDGRIGEYMERAWEYLDSPGLSRDGYYAFTASKCAPTFGHFGYFIYEKELLARAEAIYEGT